MAHACEQGSPGLLASYLHTALTVPHAQKAGGPTRQGKSRWQDKARMFCLPLSVHWLHPMPVMATWAVHTWASTPSSIRRVDKMLCKAQPGSKVHWAWNDWFGSVVTKNKRHQIRRSAPTPSPTSIAVPVDLSCHLPVQVMLRLLSVTCQHPVMDSAGLLAFSETRCQHLFLCKYVVQFSFSQLCPD